MSILNFMLPSGLRAVVRKELREYFSTPIAFVLLSMFWLLSGYFFSFSLVFVSAAHLVTAFHNMSILLLLISPLLTMRIFAEENKSGTLELLMTLPISDWTLVIGKFVASQIVLIIMLAGTATAALPLTLFARPEIAPILGGYAGILLLGTAFMAVGIFVSSLCRNQLVAAVVTWAVLTLLWFADYGANMGVSAGLTAVLSHLSFSIHYVDLIRGIINGQTVVYFASIAIVAVVLTVCGLQSRRS